MFQSFDIAADGSAAGPRLTAVRAGLAAAGVTAMLVPRGDRHMGETVAPADERLAWLTGFTGSAGLAVVMADRAVLFVDGRYTIQAAAQVDGTLFEIVGTQDRRVSDWLAEALGAEDRLAYDPWLHGEAEIAKLAEVIGRPLVALEANPIDVAWQDRPPRPAGAVVLHPESLAGETSAKKRIRLGAALAEAGQNAAVLTQPDGIAWLLNIRGSDLARSPVAQGFAILHATGRVDLFMAPEKLDGPVRAHLGNDVTVAEEAEFIPALAALAPGQVLVDGATCPMALISALEAAGATVERGTDPCLAPKALKTSAELDGMRAAHQRDGAAVCRFLAGLEDVLAAGEALDEITIVRRLETARQDTGALLDISFDTICGSGPHGAIVHYRVTEESNRTLVPGELLLLDSGGQYRDGTTDITRTVATGPEPDPDAVRAFTLVLKGMIAISLARWPAGLTGRDLDPLARTALWQAGLDYDHGTGHGVGAYLNVHEGPAGLSRRSGSVALEPGMVLSNEPGCYRAGHWGIRIENLVVVTPPAVPTGGQRAMLGFETLTLAPIDRRLIDPGLLVSAEIAWLDAYHARVAAEIGPLLEGKAATWLERVTLPLGTSS